MDRLLDLFDSTKGSGIPRRRSCRSADTSPRWSRACVLGRVVGGLFGSLSRFVLDKPLSAATLKSTPTDGMITLRQILNGQLGQRRRSTAEPADDRVKVLEELHAQGGISADKLAKLKAAIAAGN